MADELKGFFAVVRSKCGALSQSQVDGFISLLNATARLPLKHRAYCLATTWHETARTMQPIREYGRGAGHSYGQPAGPWHQVYYGRGDVQLTWERNYIYATKRLHELKLLAPELDLDKYADLALRPDIAANILVIGCEEGWFTGKKLGDYSNYVDMRRVVNGTDQAHTIAGYADVFEAALKSIVVAAQPAPQPVPAAPTPTPPPVQPSPPVVTAVDPAPLPPPLVKPAPSIWQRFAAWLASLGCKPVQPTPAATFLAVPQQHQPEHHPFGWPRPCEQGPTNAQLLLAINSMETKIMTTLSDLLAKATAETDAVNAIKLTVDGLNASVADLGAKLAAAQTAVPPDQATIDAIGAELDKQRAVLDGLNAVAANTAAAPPTPTEAPAADAPQASTDAVTQQPAA